jgi:PAS domain S-box-containing protein
MQDTDSSVRLGSPIQLRQFILAIAALWTFAIAIVLAWELLDEREQMIAEARIEAEGLWQKEDAVYRWAAVLGGVYVPVTEATRPDSRLSQNPNRDVTTPSGVKLTLVSPATVMREAFPADGGPSIEQGRVVSLRPINPENEPDAWEAEALRAFEGGRREFASEEINGGQRYLRLMRPLTVEPSCAGCHVEQGRKVGEVRGGFSVAVPMARVWKEHVPDVMHRIVGYCGMWLLGLFGITLLSRHLHRQIQCRCVAEKKLQEANELLEQRVAERTAELAKTNGELQNEIAERRQTEQWLLESEQRFRGYFEQGLIGMAILSANREWVEVNERLCRMLGYSEDELLMKTWKELTHPDESTDDDTQFYRLASGAARGFVTDRRFLRKDGRAFDAGLFAQCLRKPDGTIDGILILVQDKPQGEHG